ncbi:MAG: 3-hydroxyacyl-CoA dehydrogenase NAD-binding domain-containing protein [Porticoccaceae bacterium]
MSEQYTARIAREQAAKTSAKVARAAVLGAGIMGGGIAYQNAVSGLTVIMKDIHQQAIDTGLREAEKLLAKSVERRLMSAENADAARARIAPSLSYDGVEHCDVIVEAVVENPDVKAAVLKEVEALLPDSTIMASNTSTISITRLASDLRRPDKFCGLHFFNPVHAMSLLEIIRGEKTSAATISALVDYALTLGKKPLVVNDCPGFLVNRVLFPYFNGLNVLLRDGADFVQIDQVMERWGWPMGPAYLLDVVGMDTAVHGAAVMAEGFPGRMQPDFTGATKMLFNNNRFGQKNGRGFYTYEPDKKGRPTKLFQPEVWELFAGEVAPRRNFTEDEIIARMMAPMCTELARCLEENIVASPAEADMGLINGLGFPRFRGGVFRWLDEIGLDQFCALVAPYHKLGELYQPTAAMRAMAANGERYYG